MPIIIIITEDNEIDAAFHKRQQNIQRIKRRHLEFKLKTGQLTRWEQLKLQEAQLWNLNYPPKQK